MYKDSFTSQKVLTGFPQLLKNHLNSDLFQDHGKIIEFHEKLLKFVKKSLNFGSVAHGNIIEFRNRQIFD